MRHRSRQALLVPVLLLLGHVSAIAVWGQATSAAKAGSSGDNQRKPPPQQAKIVLAGDPGKALLHPAGADDSKDKNLHSAAADGKDQNRLAKELNAILAQPPLDRAHWGVDVVELASGKKIFSLNPEQLFLPASNTKLFTT